MTLALLAKAFSVSAPSVWNSLSYNCRSAEAFSSFRRALKTELFHTAYSERKHLSSLNDINFLTRMLYKNIKRFDDIC